MSNKNDQNSLQPSVSGQLDAAPGNGVNNENCKQICRDFIWGLCNKGSQCKYRHELDFEAMKKTLKFCHDYQNPSGCTREHCTYLHTSKEEESLFFATGTLPRVLAERHANITVATAETIPQIALFIQESLVGGPPPPPSASVAASSAPINPRPVSMPLQPPPPPPPPPPNTTAATTIQTTPLFKVPPPPPTPAFSITQPPPPLPVFDASRPPPPIPGMVQTKNTNQKRQAPNEASVPSKSRRTEPKAEEALCDACVQREIRIENYRQDMEKISTENDYQKLLYKKKLMEYQKQRDILQKLINSDYRFVQEFAEDIPQFSFREPLSDLNPSFLSGMSPNGSKHNHQQFLLQFMEYMFSNTRSFESSSVRVQESLRTLSTTPRRNSHQTPDILQTLKDILGHSASFERSVPSDLTAESAQGPVANGGSGYRPYPNGHRVEARAAPPTTPLPPPAPLPPPVSAPAPPPAPVTQPAPPPYPHYPPPTLAAPRPPVNRAALPCPPYTLERYPSPSAASPYYHYQ